MTCRTKQVLLNVPDFSAACILITYRFSVNLNIQKTICEISIVEDQEVSREIVSDRFLFAGKFFWLLSDKNFRMKERDCGRNIIDICPDDERDEKTLIALIKKDVAVSTEIKTDCW